MYTGFLINNSEAAIIQASIIITTLFSFFLSFMDNCFRLSDDTGPKATTIPRERTAAVPLIIQYDPVTIDNSTPTEVQKRDWKKQPQKVLLCIPPRNILTAVMEVVKKRNSCQTPQIYARNPIIRSFVMSFLMLTRAYSIMAISSSENVLFF